MNFFFNDLVLQMVEELSELRNKIDYDKSKISKMF